jgi:hypothetical protein
MANLPPNGISLAMTTNTDKSAQPKNRFTPLLGIFLGVAAWGLYHIVGMLGFHEQVESGRAIVLASCSVGFLGFWGLALLLRSLRHAPSADDVQRVSWASVTALAFQLLAISWVAFLIAAKFPFVRILVEPQGWTVIALDAVSLLMAMIGVSQTRPFRGKSLTLWVFGGLLAQVVLYYLLAV